MSSDSTLLGIGALALAVVMTFLMPVSVRRVNQTLIAVIIAVLCFVGAYALFDASSALLIGIGLSLAAIIYRALSRFIHRAIWSVTKYGRRDYWYRRVGQAALGRRRPRRRW